MPSPVNWNDLINTIVAIGPDRLGLLEWVYLAVIVGVVLSSFAFPLRPFTNLALTIFFLACANIGILRPVASAMIGATLVFNCFLGVALTSGLSVFTGRNVLLIPLTLGATAGIGAINGLFRGNQLVLVLGDVYQLLELPLLLLATRVIVTIEPRFRTMTYVLIGSIMAGSAWQMAAALTGATYLPLLDTPDGGGLVRFINYNTAIAFCALIGALPFVRMKTGLIAALAFVEISIILSWTRGLWAAAAAAVVFLVLISARFKLAILAYAVAAAIFGVAFLYLSGLGGLAEYRIAYTAKQLHEPETQQPSTGRESPAHESRTSTPPNGSTPPDGNDLLRARRRLEYDLIVPEILAHPVLGQGLGATYRIPGDAVIHAPKGQVINHHFMHNMFLEIGFRLGIPALLIYLTIFWTYFREALTNLRAGVQETLDAGLTAGLIAAVFGQGVFSLTEPVLLHHPTAGLAGCVMGLTMTTLPALASSQLFLRPAR